jgi:hypothetical protein
MLAVSVAAGCDGTSSLEWHEEDGYRWAELTLPRRGEDGFERLSPSETGIEFVNSVTADQAMLNEHLYNGSGVALGDADGDGLVDVYFARLNGPNVLYRNMGGWRFEDMTDQAGVALPGRFSTGTTFADVDGDGDLDLLTTSMGDGSALFLNDGTGVFEDRTEWAGLTSPYYGTTQTLADVDGDGDLDLYVANNKIRPVRDVFPPSVIAFDNVVEEVAGEFLVKPEFRDHYRIVRQPNRVMRFEYAEPDKFYLNDGQGRFEEVPFTGGRFLDEDGLPLSETPTDWGLTARFHDIDRDGDPDLYVCNDFESPDRLWINDGTGHFRAIERVGLRATSNATMTMDFSDIDLDGDEDFILIDMLDRNSRLQKTQVQAMVPAPVVLGEIDNRPQIGRNTLLMNRGDDTFAEIAEYAGVEASGWSWSILFVDVDFDGYEDILIGTGHQYDFLDSDTQARVQRTTDTTDWRRWRFQFPNLHLPNVAFRNNGDLTFDEVAEQWGFADAPSVEQGAATADLDLDGDLDVVMNGLGFPAGVYRNESNRGRVAIRLRGLAPNTQGVGAQIRVTGGPVSEQRKEVTAGGLYTSGADPVYAFATGDSESITIAVEWRSGRRSVVEAALPNRYYEIHEEGATDLEARDEPVVQPFFADVSAQLDHIHTETDYLDHMRQPLLRHRLSQLGPGITWHDTDRDGDEDLYVTSGRGGALAYFRNDGGELTRVTVSMGDAPLDQTAALPVPDGSGGFDLLLGQMNYEAANPDEAREASSVVRLEFGADATGRSIRPIVSEAVAGTESSTGHMALADYDRDGDLDLFVAGRVLPARYPTPASSRLLRNERGTFVIDSVNSEVLSDIGMVSSAIFTDVETDGDPDLVLALDWGSLRLLVNEGGRYSDATDGSGLENRLSMWNGITAGDFDGDGMQDLIATSWGGNTRLDASSQYPLRMYYGDLDGNGTTDILEARYEPRMGDLAPIRGRMEVTNAIPFVGRRIESFGEYADATIYGVLGDALDNASSVELNGYEHVLFLNRGGRYDSRPLPTKAQLSPSFYAGVADFDGDGDEDVFLTQNFYPVEPEMPRYAAGRGLWLKGDGSGGFTAQPTRESGIQVYGDQRGAALSDYDGDGRVDIAISQNGNRTRLYRNMLAEPGLRVRLVGPPGNPDAIGATVRLVYGEVRGPAREVRAGSGFWSHDGPVQVMGTAEAPSAVWVRWPDGSESTTPVQEGTLEIAIRVP